VHDYRAVGRKLSDARTKLRQRDRYPPWDHAELTFAGVADVDERDRVRGEELVELGRGGSLCLLDQISQLGGVQFSVVPRS